MGHSARHQPGTFCQECALSKSKRISAPRGPAASGRRFGALIHADILGPMPSASLSGRKFALVLTDDATRYSWVFPLVSKSYLVTALRDFVICERLKSFELQSDNAEFRSKAVADFAKSYEVRQRFFPALSLKMDVWNAV